MTSRVFVPSWLIVFVVSVAALAPLPAWAQTGPQARAAQVQRVGGTVEARRGAAGPWTRLRPGGELLRGDSVRTYPASFAQLNFDVGGQWQLPAESELDLTPAVTDGPGRITVRLQSGRVVARWRPDQQVGQTARVTVVTPSGQASIVGTEWSLRVEPDGKSTLLVLDGRVEFWNEAGSVSVAANEAAEMAVGRAPAKLLLLSPEDRVQWVAAYQPDPARYSVGGDTLANTELIQADALIGGGDLAAARARVEAGQMRFPADARFDALLSRLTLFEGQSAASRSAADAAVAKDATAVDGWLALGEWGIRAGDLTVAQRGFAGAGFVAPQDARAWFGLGSIASDREEFPSAKRFLGTALRLDPDGPGYRGQLGLTYTLANQLGRAAKEYAAALEQQPDDYVSLTGRALLALKQGREHEAIELLQRVTLFEPRYARAHMYLGVAYYRQRRVEDAIGELKRASREDPRDPLPYMMLTQIHTDSLDPWKAIAAAREAQARMPYLKSLNQLADTQKGTANLGHAFALFGLEGWSQHFAQESYSTFWSGSHLFLGARYPGLFLKNSEYFQGILTDPGVVGASSRHQTLLPRTGHVQTVSLLASADSQGASRWLPSVGANGTANPGLPLAYNVVAVGGAVAPGTTPGGAATLVQQTSRSVTASAGAAVTPSLRLFSFGTSARGRSLHRNRGGSAFDLALDQRIDRADIGLAYAVGPSSLLWVKAGGGRRRLVDEETSSRGIQGVGSGTDTVDVQLRHSASITARYEIAGGFETARTRETVAYEWLFDAASGLRDGPWLDWRGERTWRQAWGSVRARLRNGVVVDGAVASHRLANSTLAKLRLFGPGSLIETPTFAAQVTTAPRFGATVRLSPGLVARAAYQHWARPLGSSTLAPVATAGIPVDDRLLREGGEIRRVRGQVEWPRERMYAVGFVDWQRVRNDLQVHAGRITAAAQVQSGGADTQLNTRDEGLRELQRLVDADPMNIAGLDILEATPQVSRGIVRAAGVAVNGVVNDRLSFHSAYTATYSRHASLHKVGGRSYYPELPYLPRGTLSGGSTWLPLSRLSLSGLGLWRGVRYEDAFNTRARTSDLTAAASLYWESRGKRVAVAGWATELFSSYARPSYTVAVSTRY
jgi:Flp pilus assembly protein TadD